MFGHQQNKQIAKLELEPSCSIVLQFAVSGVVDSCRSLQHVFAELPYSSGVDEQFEILSRALTLRRRKTSMGHSTSFVLNCSPPASTTKSPQFKRLHGSLNFTIQFNIRRRHVPVFFVEVKSFRSLKELSADKQMPEGYREFASRNI